MKQFLANVNNLLELKKMYHLNSQALLKSNTMIHGALNIFKSQAQQKR